MKSIQFARVTLAGVMSLAWLSGCETPPDNMPAPNSQVGKYPAGSGVGNSSANEYPRQYGPSQDGAPSTQPAR